MSHGSGQAMDAEWLKASAEEEGIAEEFQIAERPKLPEWLAKIYALFCCLSKSRQFGFSMMQPITMEAMQAAFSMFFVLPEDYPEWVYLVQALDKKWLEISAPKTGKEKDQ